MKNAAILLAVVFLATAVAVAANPGVTHFTGTETPLGPPRGDEVICPDGAPTGTIPPCTEGRVHLRNFTVPYVTETTDARLNGAQLVILNANFDGWAGPLGPGSGPMWGTVRIDTASGTWEGSWVGKRTIQPDGSYSDIRVVAFGVSGDVAGLQGRWTVTYTPASPIGMLAGEIMDPGK